MMILKCEMRIFSFLILFVLGLIVAACNLGSTEPAPITELSQTRSSLQIEPGDHQIEILSAGLERDLLLHIPKGYQDGKKYPLLVALHGRGGTSSDMAEYTGFNAGADQEGFIVMYPQAIWENRTWMVVTGAGSLEDLSFIWDAITYAIDNLSADPERIFVAGFSNGGGMAHRVGCALAGKIAGIAAVAGSYPVHENCEPAAPLSVIAFHGTLDYFVPYEGDNIQPSIPEWAEAWAKRNKCQDKPEVIFDQDGILGASWVGCDGDVAVTLYTVGDGGHQWLGSPTYEGVGGVVRRINATEIILEFFESPP